MKHSIDLKLCNIATYNGVIVLVKNIILLTLDPEVLRPLYLHLFKHLDPEAFLSIKMLSDSSPQFKPFDQGFYICNRVDR